MLNKNHIKNIQNTLFRKKGLNVEQYKDDFFIKQVEKRLEKTSACADEYVKLLAQDNDEVDQLINNLTIYHTSFFRDLQKYKALGDVVLPALVKIKKNKRKLSIWSAGCASGEEPYSIAMVAREYFGMHISDWDIEITATDINEELLGKAQKGLYPVEQLAKDSVTDKLMQKYFVIAEIRDDVFGEMAVVNDDLKKMVSFKKHNLIKDRYPEGFDVIFCRNVLIYIKYEYTKNIILKFHACLNPGGNLFLGNFESLDMSFVTDFERIKFEKEFLYKKIVYGSGLHKDMIKRQKRIQAGLGLINDSG